LLDCYRLAAIFHPTKAAQHTKESLKEKVQQLKCFPILEKLGLLSSMQIHSDTYLEYCQASDKQVTFEALQDKTKQRAAEDEAVLGWWRRWGGFTESWALAARIIFSIAPSSAAVERKFSVFKRLFQEKSAALADMQEATLMVGNRFDK